MRRSSGYQDLAAELLLAGMSDAFFLLDERGCFTLLNAQAEKLLGQPADELTGTPLAEVFRAGQDLAAELTAARTVGEERLLELYLEPFDRWCELRVRPAPQSYYVFFRDITDRRVAQSLRSNVNAVLEQQVRQRTRELERANAQLIHDALHDALTGLPNRALFMDRLEGAIRAPGPGPAVLFLDFDRFKIVNDSLGHAVGDDLLVTLGRRLQTCLRQRDTLARLGGDEFIILLEDVAHVSDALDVARRIQEQFMQPFFLRGHEIYISVSIGVVCNDGSYRRASELLRDADVAMYRAKTLGKACYAVFDTDMREQAVAVLAMESELRLAIEREGLEVFYQPLVRLADRAIAGFEALARWRSGSRGFVSPAEFIPVAEESGLIHELDRFVLRAACRQLVRWQDELTGVPPITVSVNVSGKQLLRPHMAQAVLAELQSCGLTPDRLCLEITESVLMDNAPVVQANLAKLKALGLQLHIDDFGMGYSSLSYLQRFPAHCLKIDRTFIDQMNRSAGGLELVRTMITMAHNLHMQVVAEGVETEAQLEALVRLGCDYAQGYLLGRPQSSETARELLGGRSTVGAP